jgi:hypothetical protein
VGREVRTIRRALTDAKTKLPTKKPGSYFLPGFELFADYLLVSGGCLLPPAGSLGAVKSLLDLPFLGPPAIRSMSWAVSIAIVFSGVVIPLEQPIIAMANAAKTVAASILRIN